MAIKGAQAKEEIIQEILNYFGDRAFKYDKEVRIKCVENGEPVQIKLAFTAAKVAVEPDGENALPGTVQIKSNAPASFGEVVTAEIPQPTKEERETVQELMRRLGL